MGAIYIAIYNIQYIVMMMTTVLVDGYNMQMVAIIHVNPLRPAPLS